MGWLAPRFKRFTPQGAEAPLQALMDLTERDLLVATLVSTPVEQRSRLYACAAENELPLPLAFSGLRCPCPLEEQVEGDFMISQVDRGVTVHWEAFEALLALPGDRPALLSLGAQGCSQAGKSTLLKELLGLDAAVVEAQPSRPPCRSPAHNPGVDLLRSRAPLGWTVDVHGCSLGDPTWMALIATFAASSALILLHVSPEDFAVPDEDKPQPKMKPDVRIPASRRVSTSGASVSSTSSNSGKITAKAELMALLKLITDAKFSETGPRRRILVLLRDVTSTATQTAIQSYLEAMGSFSVLPLEPLQHLAAPARQRSLPGDALDAQCQVASRSIDQLIWQAPHEVAKAVTLFGPGVVVLPMMGRVSGLEPQAALEYSAHPSRASGGLMDRLDLELKFGPLDPSRLIKELSSSKEALEKRLEGLANQELQEEVLALQDWREKAMGRLKTLEKRAAWAFLGVAGEGVASQAEIKKAFKRRALELHPDKGGDADRFRLLQEMRDLLVEPKSHALEGGKEARKDKEGKKDEKKDNEDEEADEEEEEFSDDSWDADEEFRKMFPKRKKKKKQPEEAEAEVLKEQDFHRGKFEAQRRKLQRQLREMWMRACRLSEEIQRSQTQSGAGDALRQLRKFVDRFAVTEVQKLRTDDPKKAQRIFRRFLEQGAEVLCAAGALDPAAAVSVVAMQVNCPLLQATEEDGVLQRKCQALLEAIQELPSIGEQVGSIPTDEGLAFELLLPDDDAVGRDAGQRTARRVLLQLPTDATLGCLRAAAQHCGGFDRVPRLFAKGRFVAGADSVPLSALQLGSLQCLPSNLTRRSQAPKPKPTAPAPTVPASAATPVAPVAPVAVSVETLKRVEPMVARDEQAEPAEQPIAGKPVEPENDENKENDDAWFDDFFAEKKEKREAHQKAQEQGKNAMQARLKAQKQALEAKKRQDAERHGSRPKAVTPSPKAVTPSARPEAKKPEPETRGQSEPDERKESRALVVSKDEPCLKLQKSRDSWEDSWSHPCAGAKRSDGSAIFCGPCDGWITLGSRFEHEDFEMHCEKVGHFGWID
ncbi:unnamed protein product [Durusdinium trenchii]|uniref:J domain-containing protein n=1 Tax=Durusdinium trenchii TaxID=1381693 RepID=A0ABP0LT03_9DINO